MRPRDQGSWHGRVALKQQVLEQVATHRAEARLAPLVVDGRAIGLYGWSSPADLPEAGRVLGLPPVLLAIGLLLFEGFPEDPRGTQEHLDGMHRFLSALPVGRALGEVGPELLARWLLDEDWGLGASASRPEVGAAIEVLALQILEGTEDPRALETLHQHLSEEAAKVWRAAGTVPEPLRSDLRLVRELQLLTRLRDDPENAYRALSSLASDAAIEALVQELYALLGTAG